MYIINLLDCTQGCVYNIILNYNVTWDLIEYAAAVHASGLDCSCYSFWILIVIRLWSTVYGLGSIVTIGTK